jgi:ATP-dependent helicase HrpB
VRLESSRLRGEPLFLAIDVDDVGGEAAVRLASAVERGWLDREPLAAANLRAAEQVVYSPARRQVEARLRTIWIDLVLDETPVAIRDTAAAATLLAQEAVLQLDRIMPGPDTTAGSLFARARWLAETLPDIGLPPLDAAAVADIVGDLCSGLRSLDELVRADWVAAVQGRLGYDRLAEIDRLAPTHVELANGKRLKLAYAAGGPPILAARIQELFGVRETPRVAGGRVTVLLHLLGPNHRPQQVTADLAGFWQNTYPQVKKELRRRYPKHAWPDDPLQRPSKP